MGTDCRMTTPRPGSEDATHSHEPVMSVQYALRRKEGAARLNDGTWHVIRASVGVIAPHTITIKQLLP